MAFVAADDHFFGLEGAGVVINTGKDVENVKAGDRVFIVSQGNGCLANRTRVRQHGVFHLPEGMTFEVRLNSADYFQKETAILRKPLGWGNLGYLLFHRYPMLGGSGRSTRRPGKKLITHQTPT
jgi:hypothetical protein